MMSCGYSKAKHDACAAYVITSINKGLSYSKQTVFLFFVLLFVVNVDVIDSVAECTCVSNPLGCVSYGEMFDSIGMISSDVCVLLCMELFVF